VADEHPLEGFTESDQSNGDRREVSITDGILTVEIRDLNSYDSVTRHYRLTEVEQRWVEVQA